MPSPRLREKARHDELSAQDRLELVLSPYSSVTAAEHERFARLWRQHGAAVLRDSQFADGYEDLREAYGEPDSWGVADERARIARRAEVEAGWERKRRQYQEFQVDEESA